MIIMRTAMLELITRLLLMFVKKRTAHIKMMSLTISVTSTTNYYVNLIRNYHHLTYCQRKLHLVYHYRNRLRSKNNYLLGFLIITCPLCTQSKCNMCVKAIEVRTMIPKGAAVQTASIALIGIVVLMTRCKVYIQYATHKCWWLRRFAKK